MRAEPYVSLVWATPNIDTRIAEIARVSNPKNQNNPNYTNLIAYLIEHGHWSPFEMASACMAITTSRSVSRQMLRHRSFSFQEFSQRYGVSSEFPSTQCRLQDPENRQSSIPVAETEEVYKWWENQQAAIRDASFLIYENALKKGIAKEVARAVLPEGLTSSTLYMTGTIRSWIHYFAARTAEETQKEHQHIAKEMKNILKQYAPVTFTVYDIVTNKSRLTEEQYKKYLSIISQKYTSKTSQAVKYTAKDFNDLIEFITNVTPSSEPSFTNVEPLDVIFPEDYAVQFPLSNRREVTSATIRSSAPGEIIQFEESSVDPEDNDDDDDFDDYEDEDYEEEGDV